MCGRCILILYRNRSREVLHVEVVGFFALSLDLAAKFSYMTICLLSVASQNAYGKIKRKKYTVIFAPELSYRTPELTKSESFCLLFNRTFLNLLILKTKWYIMESTIKHCYQNKFLEKEGSVMPKHIIMPCQVHLWLF